MPPITNSILPHIPTKSIITEDYHIIPISTYNIYHPIFPNYQPQHLIARMSESINSLYPPARHIIPTHPMSHIIIPISNINIS